MGDMTRNNRGETHLDTSANGRSISRSEEHTSELQSRLHLVCRLLLEKKLKAQSETPGIASIVIVNYRGADDTCTALAALRDLHWQPDQLAVIVVSNASGDGSLERIAKEHPDVRVLTLDDNRGFAAGCNAGAQVATGQYIAFLNNDARPDPD